MRRAPFIVVVPFIAGSLVGCEKEPTVITNPAPPELPTPEPEPLRPDRVNPPPPKPEKPEAEKPEAKKPAPKKPAPKKKVEDQGGW